MSKKIIYLLSLLMALSLVFASCKKNSPDVSFTPDTVPNIDNTGDTGSDGLFDDYSKITNTEPIAKKEVTRGNGTDYVRNPVIVNLGKGSLVVFAEFRWKRSGAANDVGIDGHGIVDIVYYTSKDSGKNWNTREKYVNQNNLKTETIDASHGAPVVFYDKGNGSGGTIVVVASSGTGIGRDNTPVEQRGKSKIDYIKGTVTVTAGADPKITWDTGWKTIDGIEAKLSSLTFSGTSLKPTQFATHSARGVIAENTLYLPVTVAYQGNNSSWDSTYELMGYILATANISSLDNWTIGNPVGYEVRGRFTKYKEARATSKDRYLVVPSPSYSHNIMGKGAFAANTTTDNGVTASEGSAGYLLVPQWFGSKDYTISGTGSDTTISAGSGGAAEENVAILTHVQQQDKNMHMYVVTKDGQGKKNSGSYKIVDNGKSSSIDILEDGTIITAAEEGLAGANRNYYIVFSRYSQKFINAQTGGN